MAPYNKLLIADRTGKPMIARVVDNVLSSKARPILVVTGHQAEEVRACARRPTGALRPCRRICGGTVGQPEAGIAAVPEECAAALVCLGDMPLVTGRMIDRLLGTYDPDEGRLIVLPTFRGKQATRCCGTGGSSPRSCRSPAIPAHACCSASTREGRRGGDGRRCGAARLRHHRFAERLPQRLRPEPIG